MANLFETTFESGSDGSPITPSAEGFETLSGTVSYDGQQAAHGTTSAKIVSVSSVGYLQWYAGTYPAGDFWGRQYVHVDQTMTVPVHLVGFWDGSLQKASIVLLPDGTVSLRNYSLNVDRVISAPVWGIHQWMRIEWRIAWETDNFEAWIYTDPDSSTEAAHIVLPAGVGIPKWHRIRFGMSYSGVTDSYITHWDNIALSQDGKIGASPPDPVPPVMLVHAWTGGVTNSSASIKIKTTNATSLQLAYAVDTGSGDPLTASPFTTATLTPDAEGMAAFTLSALSDSTSYVYGIVGNGTLLPDRMRFKTMLRGPGNFTVAFSSAQLDGSDHAVFDSIRGQSPALFLHLGDLWSTLVSANDPAVVRSRYDGQLQAGTGRFKNLLANVPVDYVWNVTDWGGVGADSSIAAAPALMNVYDQYVPTYPLIDANSATYHSIVIGRVVFLVLDVRSRRTSGSVLGADQKTWLLNQLRDPTAVVKIIVCPLPWRASSEWGDFTDEFNSINDYITTNNITNVMMLGGTEHALALDSGANSGVNRVNALAGALDGPGTLPSGSWDEGVHQNAAGAGQYGLLAVSDVGGAVIDCTFTGLDHTGTQLVGPFTTSFTAASNQAQVKYWDGSQWILVPLKTATSTGWIIPPVKTWDGTAWRTI